MGELLKAKRRSPGTKTKAPKRVKKSKTPIEAPTTSDTAVPLLSQPVTAEVLEKLQNMMAHIQQLQVDYQKEQDRSATLQKERDEAHAEWQCSLAQVIHKEEVFRRLDNQLEEVRTERKKLYDYINRLATYI